MYLHEDRELFEDVIGQTALLVRYPRAVVEKDYYVTMILKLLSERQENCVFKGGTSLSKGFHVLNRFSEDIDITFTEHIGEARRKKLKNQTLKEISKELQMPILNWDNTQSDRDYNAYIFGYEPLEGTGEKSLHPGVKLETALGSYAFPTETVLIDNYVRQFLVQENEELIDRFQLNEFPMKLQSVVRTYIDKIYALCDYYLEGKSERYSRHMYDIYKLAPLIRFDLNFFELVKEIRAHRAEMPICPSAQSGMDISVLLKEICETDFYKSDYAAITGYFIQDMVSYENAKAQLMKIADMKVF